jgi:hypothetical protein
VTQAEVGRKVAELLADVAKGAKGAKAAVVIEMDGSTVWGTFRGVSGSGALVKLGGTSVRRSGSREAFPEGRLEVPVESIVSIRRGH